MTVDVTYDLVVLVCSSFTLSHIFINIFNGFTLSLFCFRWSFGDGGYKEFQYKPPYPPSQICPESPSQVLLSSNVTYIYSQPGNSLSVLLPYNLKSWGNRQFNLIVF